MAQILLADDHEMVRRGVKDLLEGAHPDWHVCAEAADGREAVDLALNLKPDVAVLDLTMREMGGLEATRIIRGALPQTEVLIYSMHEREHLVVDVLAAGARGYVLKAEASQRLVAAVEALLRHQTYFSGPLAQTMQSLVDRVGGAAPHVSSAPTGRLTSREIEILRLLAAGKSNAQIASTLHIAVKTAETHRATIMRKLGTRSIVELVRYAVRNHLIET